MSYIPAPTKDRKASAADLDKLAKFNIPAPTGGAKYFFNDDPNAGRLGDCYVEYTVFSETLTFASRYADSGPEYDTHREDIATWTDLDSIPTLFSEMEMSEEGELTVVFYTQFLDELLQEWAEEGELL